MRLILGLVVAVVVVSTLATTSIAVVASRANYPGAAALEALHRAVDEDGWGPEKVRCSGEVGGVDSDLFFVLLWHLCCIAHKKKHFIWQFCGQIDNWNHLYLSIFPVGYSVILL